ncbi:MAG TPA: alpha-glucan family phosphorylase, partial [Rhodothermales bacterium]|nr:alpha-glucan family phosphorylase [Rhodothermales bacterium]
MTTRDQLAALAANLWWTWHPEAIDLFRRLNPNAFRASNNAPVAALRATDEAVLNDAAFAREVEVVYEAFQQYMNASPTFGDAPRTSYFCMEYGLHESLPLYSGGLGVLAGDHVKATSDLGLPFTAIGMYLKDGYFRQRFDDHGWQHADYFSLNPDNHPLTLVTNEHGDEVTITVHLGHQPLLLRAWRLDVGRTPLYLLDADVEGNPEPLRTLTHKLYQGDRKMRLQQEIVLGIGGIRLLRALGIETDVYHMNEGHCAFLTLELLREQMANGTIQPDAEAWVCEQCVFTTHTPVPAGHDRFVPSLFNEEMAGFRAQTAFSESDLLAYGRVNPHDDHESFTMTVLGLHLARHANGVSALHGEVARRQWHHFYPGRSLDEVPIASITNGIHVPTWTAPPARDFLSKHLGDWLAHRHEPDFGQAIADCSDEDLWALRSTLRRRLIDFINERVPQQSLPQTADLNPDALTIGFARRFATYKRAPLLFSDMDRIVRLFEQTERPLQVIFAGKAHPADEGGKRYIQQIYEASQHPALRGKVLFLENYNMEVGRMLVSGCDVWLNNPRRPLEASGTSGQKIATHGGMNLSVLDGWWPEGYNGQNGWAIGREATG